MGRMRQFRRELRSNVGRPVAYQISDGRGAAMVGTLERVIRGERVHDGDLVALLADEEMERDSLRETAERLAAPMIIPAGRDGKATALVSARGMALYDVELQPLAFSTLLLGQTVASLANDPEIGTVVIQIDTPGGVVTGTPEAADAIYAARRSARVVALVNPLAASAGYWLAAQAEEVVAVPSADVGSIGVFMLHADCSRMIDAEGITPTFIFAGKYKTEGNPFEPLGDEARAYFQSEVDTTYAKFIRAVARGRGVSAARVEADFGQGRTLMADAARRAGMVDRVMPLPQAMARFGVSQANLKARRRGESAHPAPAAGDGGESAAPDEAADAPALDETGADAPLGEINWSKITPAEDLASMTVETGETGHGAAVGERGEADRRSTDAESADHAERQRRARSRRRRLALLGA